MSLFNEETWLPEPYLLKFPDSQMHTFPGQMNEQFVLVMASKLASQQSSPPIYHVTMS